MATWFHCNKCFRRITSSSTAKYILTNCGHIYCEHCMASGQQNTCYICRSECTTIPLSSNLSPDVQIFFTEADETLLKLTKVTEFQKNQGKKLFEHILSENKMLQNKYDHAKDYIKKQAEQSKKQAEHIKTLQKDNQRLQYILKTNIGYRGTPPTNGGSCISTPATVTPSSANPNRFQIRGGDGQPHNGWNRNNVMNRSAASNQNPTPFRTPSIFNKSMLSVASSSDSRAPLSRGSGSGDPNKGPRYLQPSPNINLSGLNFGGPSRRQSGMK